MIVMKFGGTSNQDAAAMSNVIRIVKAYLLEHPIVVISAIAKATNELEESAHAAARGNEEVAGSIVTRLFERHNAIIDNLITSRQVASELEAVFYSHLAEIKALIKGIAILRELTPRSLDAICSYGERLSSRIIAAGLKEGGVDSVWIDAKDFMITDDNFGRAQPMMEKVTKNLETEVMPLVTGGQIPVTQGFIGATSSGAYTTMGRESSDYSASIIGAALNADRVQIWTDVDGILTADPRVVQTTKKLGHLSFEEAFELSYFGAKILHPATMLPVIAKRIPVQILNSKREGTGTLVDVATGQDSSEDILKSIAYKNDLSLVMVTPYKRFSQYVFWESIFSVLTQAGIATGMMSTSEYGMAFTVDGKVDVHALKHQLDELGNVSVAQGKASLCLVGKGLRGRAGVADRIFRPLSDMKIYMMSYGASDLNLTLLIDNENVPRALNRLHKEFFDSVSLSGTFESIAH